MFRAIVGDELADAAEGLTDAAKGLTPEQMTDVAEVVKDGSFVEGACDYMPALIGHTFRELCVVVHTASTTPALEGEYTYGTRTKTPVRVFLDERRRHYDPIKEVKDDGWDLP